MKERNKKALLSAYGWADSLLFALGLVILLFTFGIKSYRVEGDSMAPTLHSGQHVLALDFFYAPTPGDIVVVDANNAYGKPLIKRVIAVGGQTVEITPAGELYVDGILLDSTPGNVGGETVYPLVVPEGCVFLMGDNRARSLDSRSHRVGLVDERSVVGREIAALG